MQIRIIIVMCCYSEWPFKRQGSSSDFFFYANFQVYLGHEGAQEKGLVHRVVIDLATPYYGSHLSIYMDSFYTGVELLEEMKAHGLNACGTIRANRKGLPKSDVLTGFIGKAWLSSCSEGGPHIVHLAGHKDCHGAVQPSWSYRDRDSEPKERGSQSEVVVPACLADYQKHMKGLFDWFMFYGQKCKYMTIYYVLYIFQNYEKKVESLFSLLSFEQMCL